MISTVKSATQAQPAAQAPPPVNQKSAQPTKPQHTTKTDTVHISNAALAAVQEATETHAQTVNEAMAIVRLRDYSQKRLLQKRQRSEPFDISS